jgi:YVTN family beta-propeller protein
MIYVFPGLNRMATSNVSSATITMIEKGNAPGRGQGGPPPPGLPNGPGGTGGGGPMGATQTNWTETVIPVGNGVEGFDASPDGKEIWAANAQDGTISVIDVASKKVVQTLDAKVRGANRLKFTSDGKLVLVSSLGGPELAILSAATRKDVKRVKIGHGAAGILVQPDGVRAFVACSPDDYVAVIDLKSLEMTGKIATGKQPDGLAWAVRK